MVEQFEAKITQLEKNYEQDQMLLHTHRMLIEAQNEAELLAALFYPAQKSGASASALYYGDHSAGESEMCELAAVQGSSDVQPGEHFMVDKFPLAQLALSLPNVPIWITDDLGVPDYDHNPTLMLPFIYEGTWLGFATLSWTDSLLLHQHEFTIYETLLPLLTTAVHKQRRLNRVQLEHDLLWTLLEFLPHNVYGKDAQSKILFLNNSTYTLFQNIGATSRDSIIGKDDFAFFPEEVALQYYNAEKMLIETGVAVLNREEFYNDKDGSLRYISTTKLPLHANSGKVIGFVGWANDITEQKLAEERSQQQQEVISAQQQAILDLSTPIIPLMDGILILPLIGAIDTLRARDITRSLLASITQYRAQIVILDVTGVPIIDSGVALHLDKTIQAARLKGTRTIITGISDAIAETITDLGIDWTKLETLRDLQSALLIALQSTGMTLQKRTL